MNPFLVWKGIEEAVVLLPSPAAEIECQDLSTFAKLLQATSFLKKERKAIFQSWESEKDKENSKSLNIKAKERAGESFSNLSNTF